MIDQAPLWIELAYAEQLIKEDALLKLESYLLNGIEVASRCSETSKEARER